MYSILELHAWLQDLADDASAAGDDLLDILSPNPSKLDGPRDVAVASRLNLLASGSVSYNIDDDAAQYLNFGSIKQDSSNVLYSGIKTIGSIVASSPIYIVQGGSKLSKYWNDGHVQIIIKVKAGGSLISSGDAVVFSRKWGQTYSHFDVNLAAGGESPAALTTAVDSNITLTEGQAALLSSKVAITFGDTTQDLGNGNGAKLYKGTITLTGGCTLLQAYHYLQYITREQSTTVLNSIPGWRYRTLNSAYNDIPSAPFGTYAGGRFFVAQGWYITGVLPAESTNYQLIAHDGTIQVSPTIVEITIGNLVAGDRVLVARDDGSGNILKNEYTPVAASAGANAITVVESIKTDTPSSGTIRIKSKRYTYTSYTANTKTFNGLSPSLVENIVTADDVFVPYLDRQAIGATVAQSFTYSSDFNARVDVRNGSGASPIIPFKTTIGINSSGASANVSRNPDV